MEALFTKAWNDMTLEEDLRASTLKPIIIAGLVNPRGNEDKHPQEGPINWSRSSKQEGQ